MRNPAIDPLIESLVRPHSMAELSLKEWDGLLPRARATLLLPRLARLAERYGLIDGVPEVVHRHLITGIELAREQERSLKWELQRLERTLAALNCPVLLLKGAAYVATGLPMADGRLVSDIDIMIPPEALGRAESELLRAGWQFSKMDDYDRRYYLEWMHELPPLRHRQRQTLLDVHHAILPRTSRLRPDISLLWAAAQPVPGARFLTLSPADMLLHCAAHLFQDGDLHWRLRDLFDLHQMMDEFGRQSDFWPVLFTRAKMLDLERPLYYASRYCRRILATEIPAEAASKLERLAPSATARMGMDCVIPQTLIPPEGGPGVSSQGAALFLYMRSHWLRMPPPLLAAHLARKTFKRMREIRQTG
jgi:hypothetical protein